MFGNACVYNKKMNPWGYPSRTQIRTTAAGTATTQDPSVDRHQIKMDVWDNLTLVITQDHVLIKYDPKHITFGLDIYITVNLFFFFALLILVKGDL